MAESQLLVDRADGVLTVTFNRPAQRNAMTWEMYDGLYAACEQADADDDVRVMVLRGADSRAFVAGTDIAQFADFDGADGVAYEQRIERIVDPARGRGRPDRRRRAGLLRRRRARAGGGLRPAGGDADGDVRRADRPHAGQLPVDEHVLACSCTTSVRPARSTCCCGRG